jgi:SAM-dependent methyltransferase
VSAPPPKCPFCGEGGTVPSTRFSGGSWPAWECTVCDTGVVWPLPTASELRPFYRWSTYGIQNYTPPPSSHTLRLREFDSLLTTAEVSLGGPGRLLDLGCSTGQMLEAALHRGWSVHGVEIDEETAERTRLRLGVPVDSDLGEMAVARLGRFDLIVMSHWLEHSIAPWEGLRLGRDHLTEHGILLVRVPNSRGRLASRLGRWWSWYCPPLHLFYFSRRSIEFAADRLGLQPVVSVTQRGDAHGLATELALAMIRRISRADPKPPPFPRPTETPPLAAAMRRVFVRAVRLIDQFPSLSARPRRYDDAELVMFLQAPDRGVH